MRAVGHTHRHAQNTCLVTLSDCVSGHTLQDMEAVYTAKVALLSQYVSALRMRQRDLLGVMQGAYAYVMVTSTSID